MDALLIINENWRPTCDGWISSPWALFGGPIKYIIYNILINRWAVGFEIININILYFLVC